MHGENLKVIIRLLYKRKIMAKWSKISIYLIKKCFSFWALPLDPAGGLPSPDPLLSSPNFWAVVAPLIMAHDRSHYLSR